LSILLQGIITITTIIITITIAIAYVSPTTTAIEGIPHHTREKQLLAMIVTLQQ